jgi:uncharacterized membrane protein
MNKGRLESFSDGFMAVIITIMVIELKPPAGTSFSSLAALDPKFLSYILSFVFMAIYWNNHHILFQTVQKINSSIVWINFTLLFFISLIPFCLSWIGSEGFSPSAVGLYGVILLLTTFSFSIMVRLLIKIQGEDWSFAKAIPNRNVTWISFFIFTLGIFICLFNPKISFGLYVIAVILRLIPAYRIEKALFK